MLLSVLRGIGSRPTPKRRAPGAAKPTAEGPSDAALVRRARAGNVQAAGARDRRHLAMEYAERFPTSERAQALRVWAETR